MPTDPTKFTAVVHGIVSTDKELAELLQNEIAKSKDGNVTLSTLQMQAIASNLRISANLITGFIMEHAELMDRIETLAAKLKDE